MSMKSDIFQFLEEGMPIAEIIEATGCKPSYLQQLKRLYDKGNPKTEVVDKESEQPEESEERTEKKPEVMNIIKNQEIPKQKTGMEFHKEWIAEKALECDCGCTLNRKSTYCPNCGVELEWSGF